MIADKPTARRSDSRLLCVDKSTGQLQHSQFHNIVQLLREEDLLVFNDTRVIPARLYGQKASGGKVEILVERVNSDTTALVQMRASKSPKAGTLLHLIQQNSDTPTAEAQLQVAGREGDFFLLESVGDVGLAELLEEFGHMPLPPYIKRADDVEDMERYQTVYSNTPGAVAAPTAGLHFDEDILAAIANKGVSTAFLTLHVGAGTFQPVRVDNIEEHSMHSERIELGNDVCAAVQDCKARGGRVIAVGTTSIRSLETAAQTGELKPYSGETDIFIYPGFEFRVVDGLITNFHLPESTLLMLVSAFASKDIMLNAYNEAINERYRFFSYGDAMFVANHA